MKTGADQLRDWISRRFPNSSKPQRDAADHFGWTEKYISLLVNGKQTPGLPNAVKIEDETGIPVETWVASEPVISHAERLPAVMIPVVEQGGK